MKANENDKDDAQQPHSLILHQDIGNSFSGTYYVDSVYVKLTVQNKKYTDLMLRDKSGVRNVKFWGTVDGIEAGGFVLIAARVEDYQGAPSVIATKLEKVNEPDDLADYIPTIENRTELIERFVELIGVVTKLDDATKEKTCTLILSEAFKATTPFCDRFQEAPGSDLPYYGKVGGLLLATVNVANSALALSETYGLTEKEQSMLITAALLHRLGAVDAYEFEHCLPKTTKKGLLLGIDNLTFNRLAITVRKVSQDAKAANATISQEVVLRVLHSIVACGSKAVLPTTKEAIVLDSAYRSDKVMSDAFNFMATDLNVKEEFTAFDPRTGRKYYRG